MCRQRTILLWIMGFAVSVMSACSVSSGSVRIGGGADISDEEAAAIREQIELGMHYDELHELLDPVCGYHRVVTKDGGPYTGVYREKYKLKGSVLNLKYQDGVLKSYRGTSF